MIPNEYRDILAPFMSSTPTDVLGAARALGLEVYATRLPSGVSGMISKDSSFGTRTGFVIFVDEQESPVRQRFTAAHEIGHYIHHRELIGSKLEDNYMLRAEGLSNWQEAEANRFAADLLMPRDLITDAMDRGITSVEQLAQHFRVSRVAMGIRLGLPT